MAQKYTIDHKKQYSFACIKFILQILKHPAYEQRLNRLIKFLFIK